MISYFGVDHPDKFILINGWNHEHDTIMHHVYYSLLKPDRAYHKYFKAIILDDSEFYTNTQYTRTIIIKNDDYCLEDIVPKQPMFIIKNKKWYKFSQEHRIIIPYRSYYNDLSELV